MFVNDLKAQAEKYGELIMEVQNKHKGETRHETAKRYIRERENADVHVAKDSEET